MRIDIITVLPELIQGFMQESIVGRAQRKGLVEIHIHNLRRKLKSVSGKDYITAVWGIGFMLTDRSSEQ
jgi:tRNA (guanine-N1)-methyltransferase